MLTPRNQPENALTVTIEVDSRRHPVSPGLTVAAAVMSVHPGPTRTTPVGGAPRTPYCLMGVCFDCLMEIDGKANQRACQILVREGMQIRLHQGKRGVPA